jgi:hypothetical protein
VTAILYTYSLIRLLTLLSSYQSVIISRVNVYNTDKTHMYAHLYAHMNTIITRKLLSLPRKQQRIYVHLHIYLFILIYAYVLFKYINIFLSPYS